MVNMWWEMSVINEWVVILLQSEIDCFLKCIINKLMTNGKFVLYKMDYTVTVRGSGTLGSTVGTAVTWRRTCHDGKEGKKDDLYYVPVVAFRGVTKSLPPGCVGRENDGVSPVKLFFVHSVFSKSNLGTPRRASPAWPLFKPQPRLTTYGQFGAVYYWILMSTFKDDNIGLSVPQLRL